MNELNQIKERDEAIEKLREAGAAAALVAQEIRDDPFWGPYLVAAAMGVMTAQGTPTSVATTQLRQLLVEASKGGSDLSEAIQELTGKSFPELIAEGMGTAEILDMLRSSMPEQEFRDLFRSVEAMNAALQLTGPNMDATAAGIGVVQASVYESRGLVVI